MIESLCNVALSYTPEDFNNWISGIGTLMIGIGTLFIAYAAVNKIPEKLSRQYKGKKIIETYQKVVYRMYRDVEASSEGITLAVVYYFLALARIFFILKDLVRFGR